MTERRVIPSPNIWNDAETYELENRSVDPDGAIWAAMSAVQSWDGARVLDLGCGTGFHLPLLAEMVGRRGRVLGVEPHPPLVASAGRRLAALPDLGVRAGVVAACAQELPLPDDSVDVVHNRWAYFFGPGCEPGLAELERVVAPGGVALLVDNDATRSTFGAWFRRAWPTYDPEAVQRFWDRRGFTTVPVDMRWQTDSRADLERLVRLEYPEAMADELLAGHEGCSVDYAVALRWKRY